MAMLLLALLIPGAQALVKGVPKSQQASFGGDSFVCDDAQRTLPITSVNDDYCDCTDGTDEPGTSACSGQGGRFYCVNKLYRGTWIPSSRVGDGVCDCCDASDEAEGACSNTCEEVGAAYRKALQEQIRKQQEGGAIKETWIEQGTEAVGALRAELETKRARAAELQASVTKLDAEVDEVVAHEAERVEARDSEFEERRLAALRLGELDEGALRALIVDLTHRFSEQAETLSSSAREMVEQFESDLESSKTENKEILDALDECEAEAENTGAEQQGDGDDDDAASETKKKSQRKKRYPSRAFASSERLSSSLSSAGPLEPSKILVDLLAERLPPPPHSDAAESSSIAVGADGEAYDAGATAGEELFSDVHGSDEVEEEARYYGEEEGDDAKSGGEGPYTRAGVRWLTRESTSPESDELQAKRKELAKAEEDLRDANKAVDDGEAALKADYGRENEWWVLKGQCFEVKSDGYKYEMCPFGKAKQDGNVNLGKWEGWGEEENTVMKFGGGTKCWNGPQRSLTISVVCGTENRLRSVEEPSMCTYTAEFESPAACAFSAKPLQFDLEEPAEEDE